MLSHVACRPPFAGRELRCLQLPAASCSWAALFIVVLFESCIAPAAECACAEWSAAALIVPVPVPVPLLACCTSCWRQSQLGRGSHGMTALSFILNLPFCPFSGCRSWSTRHYWWRHARGCSAWRRQVIVEARPLSLSSVSSYQLFGLSLVALALVVSGS